MSAGALPSLRPEAPTRNGETRHERFLRLFGEFVDDPDDLGLERMLEAYRSWQRSGLDRRGICLAEGLERLDIYGKRKIDERRRAEARWRY